MMLRALLWIVYMLLIGYGFVSMSREKPSWGRRVLLALAAIGAAVLATQYLATR